MLTRIEIQNFKAFGELAQFDLAPLTILVGPNGSGKTSVLEAIGLLAQTAPRAGEHAPFRWREGDFVDFGPTGESAFHNPEQDLELMLGVEMETGPAFRSWLRKQNEPERENVEKLGYRVFHRRGLDEWKHELSVNSETVAVNWTTRQPGRNRGWQPELKYLMDGAWTNVIPQMGAQSVLSPLLFTSNSTRDSGGFTNQMQQASAEFDLYVSHMAFYLKNHVFIVGADRLPRKAKPEASHGRLVVGRSGDATLSVLSTILGDSRYSREADRIRRWAGVFGLHSLAGGHTGEEFLSAGYVDKLSQVPLRMESAGFGSQQILPVITQLFAAPKGSVLLVEEPEISLHPEAQVQLVKMFAEGVSLDHQIILTTHSQTLLLALAEAAESNKLKPTDVAIYHLTPDPAGSKIQKLRLDDNWSILGWVPSFSEVESRLLKKWIGRVHDEVAKES